MSKEKFITINNIKEDTSELFAEICKILGNTPMEVKRMILGFKGPDAIVKAKEPTIHDIVTICEKKGFKYDFIFTLKYVDASMSKGDILASKAPVMEEPPVSAQAMKMEAQKSEITDSSIKDLLPDHIMQVMPISVEKKQDIDPTKIPDFN